MDDSDADGPNLGPDERDLDLLDGSWERRHYGGQVKHRDWTTIGIGLGLMALAGMVVPMLLVFLR